MCLKCLHVNCLKIKIILFSSLLLLVSVWCRAESNWQGVVTRVNDGDTLWVQSQHDDKLHKIRLIGIDAPEICQEWGTQSRDALRSLVLHQNVRVTVYSHDVYNRLLAKVSVEGRDVGAWMVSQGHAWVYQGSRRQGPYSMLQTQAQESRLGLFANEQAMQPNRFRKQYGACRNF